MFPEIAGGVAVLFRIKRPLKVAHYVTYRCNLACDMCGRREIPSKNELSTDECMALQREFRSKGTLVWSFSGGECLLRDDIGKLSRSVRELGMRLIIVTNGILLPERREVLAWANVLNVSIDGNRESHERLRGKGTFDKAVAALDIARSQRGRSLTVVINTILNNETIEHLDFMLDLAKTYRCALGFNPAIVHRSDLRHSGASKYLPTEEQYQAFVGWLEARRKGGDRKHLFDDPLFFKAIGRYPLNATPIPCFAGFFQCSVDPVGRILPCSDYFDFEEQYAKEGKSFARGYEGFRQLPRRYPCGYQFCCTAKKNYFFGNPHLIASRFLFKR